MHLLTPHTSSSFDLLSVLISNRKWLVQLILGSFLFPLAFLSLSVLWNVTFHHYGTLTHLLSKHVRAFLCAVKLSTLIVWKRGRIEVGGKVRKVRKKGVGGAMSMQPVRSQFMNNCIRSQSQIHVYCLFKKNTSNDAFIYSNETLFISGCDSDIRPTVVSENLQQFTILLTSSYKC